MYSHKTALVCHSPLYTSTSNPICVGGRRRVAFISHHLGSYFLLFSVPDFLLLRGGVAGTVVQLPYNSGILFGWMAYRDTELEKSFLSPPNNGWNVRQTRNCSTFLRFLLKLRINKANIFSKFPLKPAVVIVGDLVTCGVPSSIHLPPPNHVQESFIRSKDFESL